MRNQPNKLAGLPRKFSVTVPEKKLRPRDRIRVEDSYRTVSYIVTLRDPFVIYLIFTLIGDQGSISNSLTF